MAAYLGLRSPAVRAPWLGKGGLQSPSGPLFCCLQVFIPALNHLVIFNQPQAVLWAGY